MYTKICTKCGMRYTDTRCPHCESVRQKYYDKHHRRQTSKEFYHTSQWQWLTEQCRAACADLDLYQYYIKHATVTGKLSHHIIPIDDDPSRRYDLSNLIWLSPLSHYIIHKEYDRGPERKAKMQAKLFDCLRRFQLGDFDQGGEVGKVLKHQ